VSIYPNFIYNIVGEGPLKDDLQALIIELNAQGYVNLLGSKTQPEVLSLLEKSHILLAPSITAKNGDQEGIPVTLMEAMAMGMPVLSTKHSGIPELVQDGVSGVLVPERDIETLLNKLNYLIRHHDNWPAMGRHGRNHIRNEYDINILNDKLERIYLGLL
jgi:colanic acid/amylovoran biosynthesis glycosyltransferase